MAEEVLRLEGVRKAFNLGTAVAVEVLHGIDLMLRRGEFCALIGRPDVAEDPRFATATDRSEHRRALIELVDDVFAERDLADWVEVLRKFDTPWTVVKTAAEAAADPQATANHYLVPVTGHAVDFELVPSPAQFDEQAPTLTPAPEHGQHTEEVLLELGRSWDDIAKLQSESVIP